MEALSANLEQSVSLVERQQRAVQPLAEIPKKIRQIVSEKETIFRVSLPSPFVMLVTDALGVVLYTLQAGEWKGPDRCDRVAIGTEMISVFAGVNAVSMSYARQNDVFVHGDEPGLQMFRGIPGYCFPIRCEARTVIGYFALFSHSAVMDATSYPYMKSIASLLENEINLRMQWGISDFSEYLADQLERFELTPRERQVAALWMMDYDYKQIGRAIGISEHTVRVVTNRLNRKLQVNSKASLILRVLGAI